MRGRTVLAVIVAGAAVAAALVGVNLLADEKGTAQLSAHPQSSPAWLLRRRGGVGRSTKTSRSRSVDGIQRPTAQGGLLSVGVVESVSVCQYWISGIGGSHWPLQASSLLVGTSAAELRTSSQHPPAPARP
jgi:hypothetical protein